MNLRQKCSGKFMKCYSQHSYHLFPDVKRTYAVVRYSWTLSYELEPTEPNNAWQCYDTWYIQIVNFGLMNAMTSVANWHPVNYYITYVSVLNDWMGFLFKSEISWLFIGYRDLNNSYKFRYCFKLLSGTLVWL